LNKDEDRNRRGVFCLPFSPGKKKVRPSRQGKVQQSWAIEKEKLYFLLVSIYNSQALILNHSVKMYFAVL